MERVLILVSLSVCLSGCQTLEEHLETADGESCQRIIAQRNDTRPEAYKECRANLMQYRNQRAVASSGTTMNNTTVVTRQ
jgi:hypothetical protein